ncbi:MAG: sigma-70 family RNA polymerase sigma factor [Devosia sp.]|uniref:sigma-70 family RNA polymerase sigma factor n=1 Tax=unclassified Devosia TaxID=196773 RepID=UPI001A0CA683|nr:MULTISPECIES: sigma-70 family RNA polymerase sigma factor [unclassified Devosia]MBF0680821.1 sigma-70 family RNA polymerase sigma factor [Devosia sp.]WEJ33806.1 sigma-70 family RNA polymerase sigma factor [Devosia sp. SD17-2]
MAEILHEIEACVPALRRYARALTRDIDRADDLVQDCLERAISRRGLFQPRGPVRPWLFTILINIYRNDLRQNRRRGDVVDIQSIPEPATPAPQPGHLALAELGRALETLPLDQKEALLLVTLEGLSYQDAAKILDIPLGTLMSRLGRARSALRALTGTPAEPHLRTVK